jgi:hypothetical protein
MNKNCPLKTAGWFANSHDISMEVICEPDCGYYDEHAQQCSQVSQAMALRDIAEQLKRNADAMLDYSPAKEPVEFELQPVKMCSNCKFSCKDNDQLPCFSCKDKLFWQPK